MAVKYWVGNCFVDVSRNQITRNDRSQTVAPKALAVLTYLAQNQGQVVSQETLLTQVWKATTVSPNTLQRSIVQLRKALGDEAKNHIRTHAKQGYSLECEVRWQNASDDAASSRVGATGQHNVAEQPARAKILALVAAVVLVTGILGAWTYEALNSAQHSPPPAFDTLQLLTATDDKEFDASYAPDGQHIVFHRYLGMQCNNKLLAKNLNTQAEIVLTENWGAYGNHSFSPDGKQLIFLAEEACEEPVTQKLCFDLVSLDFQKALETPQQPSVILQCKNSVIRNPIWLADNNIALLQKQSKRWKLIKYSPVDGQSHDLYQQPNGNVTHYAYSAQDDLIAVFSIHDDGRRYIDMLKPDGRIVSSNPIQYPPDIPRHRPIYPTFDPNHEQLVFSTGTRLFTLSYEGKITKIALPFAEPVARDRKSVV